MARDKAKTRAGQRRHYERNKSVYFARAKAHTKRENARIKEYFREYLSSHPCIGCGEADPIVLEFDHRDPKQKRFDIKGSGKRSLRTVIAEVAKCDVRCANCHRRRTYMQRLRGEFIASVADCDQLSLF